MAAELSTDLTFFNGIIDETQLQVIEKNARKVEKRKSCKSNSPNAGPVSKRRSTKSPQKENLNPTDKPKRASKKAERQPLAFLNEDANVATKKADVKAGSVKTRKSTPSSTEAKVPKKERHSVPKIIVYHDSPVKGKRQKKESKKSAAGLSKSLDGWSATEGLPEKRRNVRTSGPEKYRHSFNDLTNVPKEKSPRARSESAETKSTSPQKTLKPGHPEFDAMLEKLENLFPNVDPEFLKSQFAKFKGSISQTIEFIIIKEKTNDLPTKAEYVRKLQAERLQNKFLENFSIPDFLKAIPDPWEYFLKAEKDNSANYLGHSLHYLKKKYKMHYSQAIHYALKKNGNSLYLADKELKKKNSMMKMRTTNRSKSECDACRPTTFDIQFLHEVAFIENESKIKSYIKKAETARYKKFKDAEKAGTLLQCQSCNDISLLQDDAVNCPANHVFCKNCVVKYVEMEMENNNFQFKCLTNCEERLSNESLQTVFSPFVMTKIIRRNQLEEIKAAGIEDLVYCPFCYYVAILPKEVTVFKCLNPECLMESCRLCKQFSHVPLKCYELEKFDKTLLGQVQPDVKEIKEEKKEEEATQKEEEKEEEEEGQEEEEDETLKCRNCGGEFLKKEDSNKMICPCGAAICCICRQSFTECQHFKMASAFSSSPDGTEDAAGVDPDPYSLENCMEFSSSDSDTF